MSLLQNTMAKSGTANFYNGVATQSLRWDFANTSYLNKTFGSAGSRQKFTYSCWIKIALIENADGYALLSVYNDTQDDTGYFHVHITNGTLNIGGYNTNWRTGGIEFRDPSAWYNIIIAVDTTQGTANNRVRVYVNNQEITTLYSGISNMSQNANTPVGDACSHFIGRQQSVAGSQRSDGYMAECNMINNQQLTPSSFGEVKNGVWIPIDTSGLTFGTNGFRLKFDQVGVGTASTSTIGADSSGNNNHFTSNNIVASDCAMPDSPENNFCTLNSNALFQQGTLSEGNLKFVGDGGNNWDETSSTFGVSSGKWYWEVKFLSIQQLNSNIAGIRQTGRTSAGPWYGSNTAVSDIGVVFGVMDVNGLVTNSSGSGTLTMDIAAGDVVQFRLDLDDNELSVSVDGVDKGKAWDITANIEYTPSSTVYNSSSVIYNFGQDSSFAGTETATSNTDGNGFGTFHSAVPSGYLALCTSNLPEPVIGPNSGTNEQSDDYFNTVLYTGNATNRSISGVGFQPDWVWGQCRSSSSGSWLFDSTRGATKQVESFGDNAQSTQAAMLTSFDSDGFSMGTDGAGNGNTVTFVARNWKANGGTTSSNSDGSITSTVQANTTAGFSIVTYNGEGDGQATVGHGLGVKPQVIMPKSTGTSGSWHMYHEAIDASAPQNYGILLNSTNARTDDPGFHNDTAPTASVFTIGTYNNFDYDYVAYCFAEVEGYSKFGSYTGNGNVDGTFIYLGFRPAFIMYKRTNTTGNWLIDDNKTSTFNYDSNYLLANSADAEGDTTTNTAGHMFDHLSNGFKMRNTNAERNGNGDTIIYMAFAETPFKYANAR